MYSALHAVTPLPRRRLKWVARQFLRGKVHLVDRDPCCSPLHQNPIAVMFSCSSLWLTLGDLLQQMPAIRYITLISQEDIRVFRAYTIWTLSEKEEITQLQSDCLVFFRLGFRCCSCLTSQNYLGTISFMKFVFQTNHFILTIMNNVKFFQIEFTAPSGKYLESNN